MLIQITARGVFFSMQYYEEQCFKVLPPPAKVQPQPPTIYLSAGKGATALPEAQRQRYHQAVANLLYLVMRTRSDLLLAENHLSVRVGDADEGNWSSKLQRAISQLAAHPGRARCALSS